MTNSQLINKIARKTQLIIKEHLQGQNIALFSIFLIIAFSMWYFFSLRSICSTKIKLPLVYQYNKDSIALSGDIPTFVELKISDIGFRLRKLNYKSISVELPIAKQITNSKGQISIKHNDLIQFINDKLPETVSIDFIDPPSIKFSYTLLQKKYVPISLIADFTPMTQHYFTTPPQLSQQKIQITGPKNLLDSLSAIYTSNQTFTPTKDTDILNIPLIIPNGISAEFDKIEVRLYSEIFTEKSFSLPITPLNTPRKKIIKFFPSQVQIIAKVAKKNFNLVNKEDFQVLCNFPIKETPTLPIAIKYNNPYILNANPIPQEVEYIIESK